MGRADKDWVGEGRVGFDSAVEGRVDFLDPPWDKAYVRHQSMQDQQEDTFRPHKRRKQDGLDSQRRNS